MEKSGFKIELNSHYDGWWRYNVALMCGCFDAQDERTDFCTASSHVADVGSNLEIRPANLAAVRRVVLTTTPCDHLILYLYLVPHSMPAARYIDEVKPFDITLKITGDGGYSQTIKRTVNAWSGTSLELKVPGAK